jgi:hypothetical protein
VPITTNVVRSNLTHGEVKGTDYTPPPSKTYKHDITEILLKVALNTITLYLRAVDHGIWSRLSQIKDCKISICYLSTISTRQCEQDSYIFIINGGFIRGGLLHIKFIHYLVLKQAEMYRFSKEF